MRLGLPLFLCLALCACGGTLRLRGTAPASGCLLKLIDESGRIQNSVRVAGPFSETAVMGIPMMGLRIDVVAECNGEAVKTVKGVDPAKGDTVDLGTLQVLR